MKSCTFFKAQLLKPAPYAAFPSRRGRVCRRPPCLWRFTEARLCVPKPWPGRCWWVLPPGAGPAWVVGWPDFCPTGQGSGSSGLPLLSCLSAGTGGGGPPAWHGAGAGNRSPQMLVHLACLSCEGAGRLTAAPFFINFRSLCAL